MKGQENLIGIRGKHDTSTRKFHPKVQRFTKSVAEPLGTHSGKRKQVPHPSLIRRRWQKSTSRGSSVPLYMALLHSGSKKKSAKRVHGQEDHHVTMHERAKYRARETPHNDGLLLLTSLRRRKTLRVRSCLLVDPSSAHRTCARISRVLRCSPNTLTRATSVFRWHNKHFACSNTSRWTDPHDT